MSWGESVFPDGTSKMEVVGNEMGTEIYIMTWDFQAEMCFPPVVRNEMGKQFQLMTWDFKYGTSKMKVAGNEMGKEI